MVRVTETYQFFPISDRKRKRLANWPSSFLSILLSIDLIYLSLPLAVADPAIVHHFAEV
jgi:hypothetical protein